MNKYLRERTGLNIWSINGFSGIYEGIFHTTCVNDYSGFSRPGVIPSPMNVVFDKQELRICRFSNNYEFQRVCVSQCSDPYMQPSMLSHMCIFPTSICPKYLPNMYFHFQRPAMWSRLNQRLSHPLCTPIHYMLLRRTLARLSITVSFHDPLE